MDLQNKNVNMNFRVPEKLRSDLNAFAESQGINVSQLFRNYMTEVLKTQANKTYAYQSPSDNDETKKMLNFRVSPSFRLQFFKACHKLNVTPTNVLRGFVECFTRLHLADRQTIAFDDTLGYLGIFLQNEMQKQGFAILSKEDVTTKKVTSLYPLIEEIQTNDPCSRLIQVFDIDNKLLYFMTFHRYPQE
jgi:antitoxin component of RelBE/YafQ-DinJ toxin-antitoxin module